MIATETKKPANDRIKAKVELLWNLINHEHTSETERHAARRALARIAEVYDLNAGATPSNAGGAPSAASSLLYNPGAWVGEKYWNTANLTLTEIAKLIRQDIGLARKVGRKSTPKRRDVVIPDPLGDAPREIKIRVWREHYSGGGSIEVRIENIPEGWGWEHGEPDEWGYVPKHATPAMTELLYAVQKMRNAYNYDNSDITTDLFLNKYGGSVQTKPNLRFPRR